MKIDIKNENRAILENYAEAQANAKKWAKAEKELKPQAVAIFTEYGHVADSGKAVKSDRLSATVQVKGKAMEVECLTTTKSGSIDYERAFRELWAEVHGDTIPDLEKYRKENTTAVSIRAKALGKD